MRAVITVIGKDSVGILAKVSAACAEHRVNISEVSQTVLQDMFCMIMICQIDQIDIDFGAFAEHLERMGDEMHMSIHAMHEDIFNSMHRI